MLWVIFNLLLLYSTNSVCSVSGQQDNATIDLLLLNISNQDCQSDVVNTAVASAVASQLSDTFRFNINTTTLHIECNTKVRSEEIN